MSIELRPQQQAAVDRSHGDPVPVLDPRTAAPFVLLPAERFETLTRIAEDERIQEAIRTTAFRNAAGRAGSRPR